MTRVRTASERQGDKRVLLGIPKVLTLMGRVSIRYHTAKRLLSTDIRSQRKSLIILYLGSEWGFVVTDGWFALVHFNKIARNQSVFEV